MSTVQTVLDAIERLAPAATAFEWDRIGLQVGSRATPIQVAAVALDPTPSLISFAQGRGAQLLVCHHPVVWDPLKTVTEDSRPGRLVADMVRSGLAFVGAHTNWDAAPNGINGTLADLLGLAETRPIGSGQKVPYAKLTTFCPTEAVGSLIDALAEAGAGVIGLYERCAFWTEGTGTFFGREGAQPAAGQAGRREEVAERRLEMRVPAARIDAAVAALRAAHPYEEPAYDVYPLVPEVERPMTRIGRLAEPVSLADFERRVDLALGTRCWTFGDPAKPIERVAVCGGAADDEWRAALAEGADAFVTGEVKHHNAIEASEHGLAILAAGHYATEHPGALALGEALRALVPDVEWHLYEPPRGQAGRTLTP